MHAVVCHHHLLRHWGQRVHGKLEVAQLCVVTEHVVSVLQTLWQIYMQNSNFQ